MSLQNPGPVRTSARPDATTGLSWAATLPLDGEPAPGREARTFVRLQLQSDGLGDLADDVEAIASELVRDAVERGATPSRLRLDICDTEILVAVQARGQGSSGEASQLVSRDLVGAFPACVAPAGWGWQDTDEGREVWCTVHRGHPGSDA